MLIVISPAKTLDTESSAAIKEYSVPVLLGDTEKLVAKLRRMSAADLSGLMGVSAALGKLNYERYQTWQVPFTPENAKQAVLTFNGDVYAGLDASFLPEDKLLASQQKLRILSGLYGVLKPLDLMQPYRLEMGTPFAPGRTKDLYAFWGDKITRKIQEAVSESGSKILVNLASNEYFKSIRTKKLDAQIVTPAFKDMKNGSYKIISFYAKRARGLMTRFILENGIDSENDLLAFTADGYHFNPRLSKPQQPVFTRG
jgi:uncharacterized protein